VKEAVMVRCSILIPVYNQAQLTRQCLDALLGDARPALEHEILVLDDGSSEETQQLLASYGERILVHRLPANAGFATACNAGARLAQSGYLVFLNNDTLPRAGWLEALVRYAEAHPDAAVVGSKLLFPDDTVQHAGIVICQDRYPRHLYAGFPSDHPAVNKSRPFQAVTAACALIRREAFAQVGGFDPAYRNGHEDVDLCLSLGARGHAVHYCHTSVLFHLESLSEGRFRHSDSNTRLYHQRWAHRVQPDDLRYYVEDGLLEVQYAEGNWYPIRLGVSPWLAEVQRAEEEHLHERLLRLRSRQVHVLLKEVIRLMARTLGTAPPQTLSGQAGAMSAEISSRTRSEERDPWAMLRDAEADLLRRDQETLAALAELQATLASRPDRGFTANPRLRYEAELLQLRQHLRDVLPPGARVAVVSRGDDALLDLGGPAAHHFPQTPDGHYAGHHPADSSEAIRHLEELRGRGTEYLLFPRTSLWWLEHYTEFNQYLHEHCRAVLRDEQTGVMFSLNGHPEGLPRSLDSPEPHAGEREQPGQSRSRREAFRKNLR
jgi:GT2 family glycosyltransferase